MTNYPPPQGQPYGMPPQGQAGIGMAPKTNGFGVAALVTGLLSFCIPVLGGLLAIIFGILGIKKSKQTNSGKGMSIAGLILGLLSFVVIALSWGLIAAWIQGTEDNRALTRQFINDLSAANVTAASNSVAPETLTTDELEALSKTVAANGAITDITSGGFKAETAAGSGSQVTLIGAVTYASSKQLAFEIRQKKVGDQWKISYARFDDK